MTRNPRAAIICTIGAINCLPRGFVSSRHNLEGSAASLKEFDYLPRIVSTMAEVDHLSTSQNTKPLSSTNFATWPHMSMLTTTVEFQVCNVRTPLDVLQWLIPCEGQLVSVKRHSPNRNALDVSDGLERNCPFILLPTGPVRSGSPWLAFMLWPLSASTSLTPS